jgi:hypothetical protein
MQYKRLLIQNEGYINASRIEKKLPFYHVKVVKRINQKTIKCLIQT